ncbi:MAG: PorT family protein [Paludibacteraceae bacterium]|nr:PorT family protein [Paludibacteraceae bacterium]MBP6284481.1 PorT family protein [Paludibacteraceae bacterium]
MKRYILLLALLPLIAVNAFSQNEKSLYLGLYASPNVMWLHSNNNSVEPTQSKLGFSYGLMADITLGDYYALATGLEIAQLGGKMNWTDTNGTTPTPMMANYSLKYLEIPLALKMQTAKINDMSFYGRFGGGLGVRLDAKADINANLNQTVTSDVQLLRAFFSIGGGIEYTIAYNTRLFAGIIYKSGLTNTFKQDDWSVKANALSLNVGVIF